MTAERTELSPRLNRVCEGVWSLELPMPDGHIAFSFCYLIVGSDGSVHVIDPGWDSDTNWELLRLALERIGATPAHVRTIVVTHLHPDHLGMAARLRAASGAVLALHRVEAEALVRLRTEPPIPAERVALLSGWGVPTHALAALQEAGVTISQWTGQLTPDLLLDDGQLLPIPGHDIEVILTAGHTLGHICLRDARRALLFTGDHVLPGIFPGLGLGGTGETNALEDYLASLRLVAEFDDHEVLPGHECRFIGLAERCETITAHHLNRSREVAEALAGDPAASVWEVASRVSWSAGWEKLRGFTRLSALSQTAMHIDYLARS
jgi:glyoxylase-like metal-dependent hydrolase (beta-lactamase superfamily II)